MRPENRSLLLAALAAAAVFATGCLGYPDTVKPVKGFDLDRYLGKWYEVARLDHSFERGLSKVTAEYSLKGDGGVRVVNRGFDASEGKWEEAEGKAYFVEGPDKGYLKVSFFGPFYGSYAIFELDEDYRYAFVSGSDEDYLWFLSRTPTVSDELRARFVKKAKAAGFPTDELIFVEH